MFTFFCSFRGKRGSLFHNWSYRKVGWKIKSKYFLRLSSRLTKHRLFLEFFWGAWPISTVCPANLQVTHFSKTSWMTIVRNSLSVNMSCFAHFYTARQIAINLPFVASFFLPVEKDLSRREFSHLIDSRMSTSFSTSVWTAQKLQKSRNEVNYEEDFTTLVAAFMLRGDTSRRQRTKELTQCADRFLRSLSKLSLASKRPTLMDFLGFQHDSTYYASFQLEQ